MTAQQLTTLATLNNMPVADKKKWTKEIVLRLMAAWAVDKMQDLVQFVGGHNKGPSQWILKGHVPWQVISATDDLTITLQPSL